MGKNIRLHIFKEVFLQPIWGLFLFVLGVLGNFDTFISWIEFISKKDLSRIKDFMLNSGLLTFISSYWWELILWAGILAISEKLFKIARPFLGETVPVNIEINKIVQSDKRHVSFEIVNKEKLPL